MAATSYESVSHYIAAQSRRTHSTLRSVRAAIRKALPTAVEGISYQIPIYKGAAESAVAKKAKKR